VCNLPQNEGARDLRPWRLNFEELSRLLGPCTPIQQLDESTGCPASRIFQLAGDGSSSCLESRILSPLPVVNLRVAPNLRSYCNASRYSLRVAPNPAPSGCADGESPGCPGSSLPRRLRRTDLRVAPNLAPSGAPGDTSPGLPRLLRLPASPLVNLRVAPMFRSLGDAGDGSSGCPESLIPVSRLCVSGLPRFLHDGWVVMTPRLAPNFASSAEPRMNLRIQSGLAHSRQALVCVLNLNPRSAAGKPAANRQFQLSPASSCPSGTAFQFPTGSSIDMECGLGRTVEASAKK